MNRTMNPRFSVIFPPTIWIFMEGEGDQIKSKQPSKRDRTLSKPELFSPIWILIVLIYKIWETSQIKLHLSISNIWEGIKTENGFPRA